VAWRESISCEQNIHSTFKQTGWRFRQANFVIALSVRSMWLAASGCWPEDHLDAVEHPLHANSLLLVFALPPRYRCPLDRLPASRLASCAAGWSAATLCFGTWLPSMTPALTAGVGGEADYIYSV
jgi:hypothetical protein